MKAGLMPEDGGNGNGEACAGRDAAFLMQLRRTGTTTRTAVATAPDQQRTADALRGIRGTKAGAVFAR